MFSIVDNAKKTMAFFKLSSIITALLSVVAISLVMLPPDMDKLRIWIGSICIAAFILSWILTAYYWNKTKRPIVEAKRIMKWYLERPNQN